MYECAAFDDFILITLVPSHISHVISRGAREQMPVELEPCKILHISYYIQWTMRNEKWKLHSLQFQNALRAIENGTSNLVASFVLIRFNYVT
jgi:hypothetical protein